MSGPTGDITQLLHAWRACNHEAENELFARVLPLAHRLVEGRAERAYPAGHRTSEAGLFPASRCRRPGSQNRQHFFAVAARAIRMYLIDYGRRRSDAGFVAIEGIDNL